MVEQLKSHVANGVVSEQKHPHLPLSIYNYSARCQYEKLWDEVTLQCRGLVMHGKEVIARPFRKFFNDTEHADGEIPWHLPCEVTEKLDGSLLIVFYFQGEWHTATRGSFSSEQAKVGKRILLEKYGTDKLDPAVTYLFEVLYPENRVVVDYGKRRDVILLGMIHTKTGLEWPLNDAPDGLAVVRRLPPTANIRDLRSIIRDHEEGYVLRFAGGFRCKVKGARYIELHRVLSGVSSRLVWENLSQGRPFDDLLALIPDEFAGWVRQEKAYQELLFAVSKAKAKAAVSVARRYTTRRDQAKVILEHFKEVSSAAFVLLDGKPCDQTLWKMLYPEFRRPACAGELAA